MRIIPSDGILIHTEQPLGRPQKIVCCIPTYPLLIHPPFPYPEHFLALLENKTCFGPIFIRKSRFFPMMEQWKKKNNINLFFPTYLPNQKKSTANKHFFKDGLMDSFSCKHVDYFKCLCFRERFGSARLLSTRLLDMWFRQYCSQMKWAVDRKDSL